MNTRHVWHSHHHAQNLPRKIIGSMTDKLCRLLRIEDSLGCVSQVNSGSQVYTASTLPIELSSQLCSM